jgi:hypothetical protein
MRTHLTFVLLISWAAPGQALQAPPPVEVRDLRAVPRDIADEVQLVFNAASSRRVSGDLTIAASEVVSGDVAVMSGQLVVIGRITGRVAVINGGVVVRGAGRIGGSVTVIGGTVTTIGGGVVDGSARSYPEHVLVESETDRVVVRDESEDERWYRRRMAPREGSRGDLRLVTARTYNRVEGLPLLLGPRAYMDFSWGRVTADAMGVLRSADRFELKSENLGHLLRVELQLGGARGIRLAGRLEDVIAPVEDWHLSDSEVGLASFLLHRDYRDYYNRHGGSLSAAHSSAITSTRRCRGPMSSGRRPCARPGRSCATTRAGGPILSSTLVDSTSFDLAPDTTRGTTPRTRGPAGASAVSTNSA